MKVTREASPLVVPYLQQSSAQPPYRILRSLEPSDVLDDDSSLRHHIAILGDREERFQPPPGHSGRGWHGPPDFLVQHGLTGAGNRANQRLNLGRQVDDDIL